MAKGKPAEKRERVTDSISKRREAGKDLVVGFDTAVDAERQVGRETLRAVLMLGLEDRIHWSSEATSLEGTHYGARIRVGGQAEDFDLVVAADGIGSRLSLAVYPEAAPVHLGVGGIYGRAPLRAGGTPLLPERLHDSGILAMLPRPGLAFFATAMRFTRAPGEVLPDGALPDGPGGPGDYVMWGLIPDPAETDALRAAGPGGLLQRASELTRAASPVLRNLIENTRPEDTLFSRFSAGRPGGPRAVARATAIGDAIHPMPPLGAHGGNTALRSAHALTAQLAGHRTPTAAIEAYEAQMAAYAAPVIRDAESQTARLARRGPGAFVLRRVLPLLRRQARSNAG